MYNSRKNLSCRFSRYAFKSSSSRRHVLHGILTQKFAAHLLAAILVVVALSSANLCAATESIIYAFPGLPNGWGPTGPMVMDTAGNLYGTTAFGGLTNPYQFLGCGIVFELSPPTSSGGQWTEQILYSFKTQGDGCYPVGLVIDKSGDLYGATMFGGNSTQCEFGCGTVYKLTHPTSSGGQWRYGVLYMFTGGPSDGFEPFQLLIDSTGTIYGTSLAGPIQPHAYNSGTVFQLKAQAGAYVETTLHVFGPHPGDGAYPAGGLALDTEGSLYGSTVFGGLNGFGAVYKVTPPKIAGGLWSESVLHSFPVIYNFYEWSFNWPSPIIMEDGSLFGTTIFQGSTTNCGYGCGTVFELRPESGQSWQLFTHYDFPNYGDGSGPNALYLDQKSRNLYGTTAFTSGWDAQCGVAFELAQPTTAGGPWTYSILHAFAGLNDGCSPYGNLVRDGAGKFYGVTASGGMPSQNNGYGYGAVFELTP
jgi:uncharacterized repeat protein (TIGR03803 family)